MTRILGRTLLLSAAVLAVSCSRQPATPLGIDARLAAMVPREATVLAGFRMDRIRESPLYEDYFRNRLPVGDEKARDLMRMQEQIDDVLACVTGPDTLVLVHGRFERAAVEQRMRESKAAPATLAGRPGFLNGGVALVVLDGGYALAGSRAQVEDALSRAGKTAPLPARFYQPAQSLPADSGMWVISVGQFPMFTMPERSNLANLPRALEHVELATLHADLSNGFKMTAAATCTSADDARQIQTLIRGIIGMARLSTPNDRPELLAVYDRVQVTLKERSVTVAANLPAEMVDTLADTLQLRRPPAAR